jgi:2-polyprenyl-3-methyl-5-hydroxy-6-metoxy-1,4-benzoquinol methylase
VRRNDILSANEAFHDLEADSYDSAQPYIRNQFAQRWFEQDIDRILNGLPPDRKPARVLDCGAGTGNLTLKLLRRGCNVTSVDISHEMLTRLVNKARGAGLSAPTIVHSDVDSFLAGTAEQFDLICSSSFLHHLPDYRATYLSLVTHVRPQGFVYTSFEPMPLARLTVGQTLLSHFDAKLEYVIAGKLYRPDKVAAALLRRTGILQRRPRPAFDTSLVEDTVAGVEDAVLVEVLRTYGFSHIDVYWRPIKRRRFTQFLDEHFVHSNNELFVIAQR